MAWGPRGGKRPACYFHSKAVETGKWGRGKGEGSSEATVLHKDGASKANRGTTVLGPGPTRYSNAVWPVPSCFTSLGF